MNLHRQTLRISIMSVNCLATKTDEEERATGGSGCRRGWEVILEAGKRV